MLDATANNAALDQFLPAPGDASTLRFPLNETELQDLQRALAELNATLAPKDQYEIEMSGNPAVLYKKGADTPSITVTGKGITIHQETARSEAEGLAALLYPQAEEAPMPTPKNETQLFTIHLGDNEKDVAAVADAIAAAEEAGMPYEVIVPPEMESSLYIAQEMRKDKIAQTEKTAEKTGFVLVNSSEGTTPPASRDLANSTNPITLTAESVPHGERVLIPSQGSPKIVDAEIISEDPASTDFVSISGEINRRARELRDRLAQAGQTSENPNDAGDEAATPDLREEEVTRLRKVMAIFDATLADSRLAPAGNLTPQRDTEVQAQYDGYKKAVDRNLRALVADRLNALENAQTPYAADPVFAQKIDNNLEGMGQRVLKNTTMAFDGKKPHLVNAHKNIAAVHTDMVSALTALFSNQPANHQTTAPTPDATAATGAPTPSRFEALKQQARNTAEGARNFAQQKLNKDTLKNTTRDMLTNGKGYVRNNWGAMLMSAATTFTLKTAFMSAAMTATIPAFYAVPVAAVGAAVGTRLVRDYVSHRKARNAAQAAGLDAPQFDWKKSVKRGVIAGAIGFGIGVGAHHLVDYISSISDAQGVAAPENVAPTAPLPPVDAYADLRAQIQQHIAAGHFDGMAENGMNVKNALTEALAKNDWVHVAARLGGAGNLDFNGGNPALKSLGAQLYGLAGRVVDQADLHNPMSESIRKSVGFLRQIGKLAR